MRRIKLSDKFKNNETNILQTVDTRDGNRSGRPAGRVAGRVEILRPAGQAV